MSFFPFGNKKNKKKKKEKTFGKRWYVEVDMHESCILSRCTFPPDHQAPVQRQGTYVTVILVGNDSKADVM